MRALTRTAIVPAALAVALAAQGCCFGEGIEQQEERYGWKIQDLDEYVKRAGPDTKKEIEEAKASMEKEYAGLPASGEDRRVALQKINETWGKKVNALKDRVEGEEKAREEKAANAVEAKKAERIAAIAGTWQGGGMDLAISTDGKVSYKLEKPGSSKSLDGASIKRITDKEFETSVLGISSTFRIDEAPHQEGGKWLMKIDGIEITRIDPP